MIENTHVMVPASKLNYIISRLEKTIPNFPKLNGRTFTYDYVSEWDVVSLQWEGTIDHSKSDGEFIYDYNSDGKLIGIEIFKVSRFLQTDEVMDQSEEISSTLCKITDLTDTLLESLSTLAEDSEQMELNFNKICQIERYAGYVKAIMERECRMRKDIERSERSLKRELEER